MKILLNKKACSMFSALGDEKYLFCSINKVVKRKIFSRKIYLSIFQVNYITLGKRIKKYESWLLLYVERKYFSFDRKAVSVCSFYWFFAFLEPRKYLWILCGKNHPWNMNICTIYIKLSNSIYWAIIKISNYEKFKQKFQLSKHHHT